MEKYCPKCNTFYGETDSIYCTRDQTKLAIKNPLKAISDEISVIRNKIIWNVPVGEIAYRISEQEMDSLLNVSGIVVNEGVTAYIYINGCLAAEVHGGNYDFVSKEKLEHKLNARFGGMAEKLKDLWKVITRFWVGTSLNEQFNNEQEGFQKFTNIEDLVAYIKGDAICSVVLKLDREFPLVFEQSIQTSRCNGNIGIQVMAQITDFRQFIQFFFTGGSSKQNVSNIQIKSLLKHDIAKCLQYINIDNGNVSEEEKQKLLLHLQSQTAMSNIGISITCIKDCSVRSEDLERLRELDREIYLSEQELERLHKINIIKNRLSDYETQRQIEQARGELGIRRAMNEINRDQILDEDEFEKFKQTVFYARQIREAQSREELNTALEGIRRAQILREEETDLLLYEITEKKYRRETAFSLMQLGDTLKRNRVVQDAEQDSELSALNHQIGLERIKDIYRNEHFQMEVEQEREKLKLQHDADMAAIQTFGAYRDIKEKEAAAAYDRGLKTLTTILGHEEDILKTKATMSPDQLTAEQLAKLSPEAQIEYMRAQGSNKTLEVEKEKERILRETYQEMLNRTERLTLRGQESIERIAGASFYRERERADEFKSSLHRTEDRLDRQQEQVMRYTVGNPQAKIGDLSQQPTIPHPLGPTNFPQKIKCPKCGKENNLSEGAFCAYCRNSLT